MKVTWDPPKAPTNRLKHRVRLPDVEAVFYDPRAIIEEDLSSVDEQRFIALGKGATGLLFVVVYAYRNDQVRVISARKASKTEAGTYEKGI